MKQNSWWSQGKLENPSKWELTNLEVEEKRKEKGKCNEIEPIHGKKDICVVISTLAIYIMALEMGPEMFLYGR